MAARQAAHFDEAEAAFHEARKLFETLGDRMAQGQVIGNLGALAESRNQNDQAASFYKEAITLFDEVGAADLSGETWRALSRLRMKQGKWFAALGAYDAGLQDVKHLTPTQRLLRRLLRASRRLMGGDKGIDLRGSETTDVRFIISIGRPTTSRVIKRPMAYLTRSEGGASFTPMARNPNRA